MRLKPQAVQEGGKKTACSECRPNMRVADCPTVWVCKCLQLIYLSALHLTLVDIYIAINITNWFNQTSLSWRYDDLPGAWIFVDAMICKRAWLGYGIWVLLRTNRLALFKAWEPKAKLLRSSWNWNLVKPNLSLFWHSTVPNLLNGIDSWLEQLNVMATLRVSRRSGHSELKRCIHLTEGIANFVTWMVAKCWINWHLTVAKCAVPSGLSHRLCCNKRAVRVCVAGCFNCTSKDFSVAATLRCSDMKFAVNSSHHRQPVIQYNVGQTWGLLTAPLSEFANVCSWFIWVHFT